MIYTTDTVALRVVIDPTAKAGGFCAKEFGDVKTIDEVTNDKCSIDS